MKHATKPIVMGVLLAFLSFSAVVATAYSADWAMFHADERNTGVGTGDVSGSPRILWNLTTTEGISTYGYSPIVANGILYEFVGNSGGHLYALNASTGERIWNYNFSDRCCYSPAIADGVLYAGCFDHYIYAIDAFNGTLIWKYDMTLPKPIGTVISSSPTISNGVLYAGYGKLMSTGALIAINCTTGSKIWNYSTAHEVFTSPAVADGIVYAGTFGAHSLQEPDDDSFFAVNATTGALLWTFHEPDHTYPSSPAVANGRVYIGSIGWYSSQNNVYALDAYTGELVWSQDVGGQATSSPAVDNNIICIGSANNSTYAFDALTGTQIWSYKTGGAIFSSPAISKGVVCIGSVDGTLYAFDAVTGDNLWQFASGGRISASPAVSDGKIYFISDNSTHSTIYALYTVHLIKSELAISCTSTTSYNSFHVSINGTLTVNNTNSPSTPIQISYSNNGGANWQNLTQVTTNAEGKFNADWFPSASGNYIIKTTFNGNLTHAAANTILNLAVLPHQPENTNAVFSVTSNSTITDLAFNSTSKQLTFSVNGTTNTTGYTDIRIPKSLISDISTLTILVDNNQVTYTVVSEQDAWLISFSYHHSTHTVTINLETPQNPTPTPTPTNSGSSSNNQQSSSKTPNPQKTTAPSATPTVPEFSTVAVMSLLTAVPLIATVILRKQKKVSAK